MDVTLLQDLHDVSLSKQYTDASLSTTLYTRLDDGLEQRTASECSFGHVSGASMQQSSAPSEPDLYSSNSSHKGIPTTLFLLLDHLNLSTLRTRLEDG
ncbi:unnamed protein product [Protopolystoma xenopodis]|uniref:Uncharacterized protein n=1 Tax=Protopolystoma xenopodis TaxID=117903 RepID=A0A3S5FEU4_9PLAT|nr:unnamed protein product [Protopolystoma xenopodis]